MNKILAVDLDSTLADIMPIFCKLADHYYGVERQPSEVDNWNYWIPIIGEPAMWQIFRDIWVYHWESIQLCDPRAPVSLVKALGMGYQISIITSMQRDNIPHAVDWLNKYRIPYGSIIALHKFQNKADYPWTAIIDDNPRMATNYIGPRKIFLYDQPWNRAVETTRANVYRVHTFDQAIQEL